MKFLQKKKKAIQPLLSRQEALRCTPVVNKSVLTRETAAGEILLEYPLPMKPFLKSVFERFDKNHTPPTKKLQLDEMGSQVWKLIDDSNNVKSIIETFTVTYGISLQESEKSVTTFLAELGKRGIIALI